MNEQLEDFGKVNPDTEALAKNAASFFNSKPAEAAPFLPQEQPKAEEPKVEEEKEEVKAETTSESKPEEKVEEVKTEVSGIEPKVETELKEDLWWQNIIQPEAPKEEVRPQIDDEVLNKIVAEKYGEKLKLAAKIESDPLLGKLSKVLDDPEFDPFTAFTPQVDYNSLPMEKLYEQQIRDEYGAVLDDGEVMELVQNKIEEFEMKSPAQQKVERANLIKNMPKQDDPKEYINKFLEKREQAAKQQQEFWEKVDTELANFATGLAGKELVKGVTITEQDVNKLLGDIKNPNYYYNPDGSYNYQKEAMEKLFALKAPEMLKKMYEQGRIDSVMERTNANPNTNSSAFRQQTNEITAEHAANLRRIQMENGDAEVREAKIKEYKAKYNLG